MDVSKVAILAQYGSKATLLPQAWQDTACDQASSSIAFWIRLIDTGYRVRIGWA
jgi:hypothetical protein